MIGDVFKGRAQKYNHYQEGKNDASHSCNNCLRRQYSYPYTCKDGWLMGNPQWKDRGATCINWTDKGNAPVD